MRNREHRYEYLKKYKASNPDKIKNYAVTYYKKHKEQVDENNRRWRETNPDQWNLIKQNWLDKNPDYFTLTGRIRRHHISRNCKPSWLTKSHLGAIKEIYYAARTLSKIHQQPFHVDHIEPLKGVDENGEHVSCGLHIWWNLRVIPAEDNLKKGNKINQQHIN